MNSASAYSSPLPSLNGLHRTSKRQTASIVAKAQARRCQDEDGSFDTRRTTVSIVDRNMGLLKERMEVVRKRESLEKWHTSSQWEYLLNCDEVAGGKKAGLNQFMETSDLIARNFVLAFVSSTICLCLASVAAHIAG